MKIWEIYITTGNNYIQSEDFILAENVYLQACERIEKLFHYWLDTEEIVNATISSYNNLAFSLKCQGRYKAADDTLKKAHQLIRNSLGKKGCGRERRIELLKGRDNTFKELQQCTKLMNAAMSY